MGQQKGEGKGGFKGKEEKARDKDVGIVEEHIFKTSAHNNNGGKEKQRPEMAESEVFVVYAKNSRRRSAKMKFRNVETQRKRVRR